MRKRQIKKKSAILIAIVPCLLLICFTSMLLCTTVFSQIIMEHRLNNLPQEASTVPIYHNLGTLRIDGNRLVMSRVLEENGIVGEVAEVLVVYDERVWFVHRDIDNTESGKTWNLYSVAPNGTDLQLHYSEMFGLDGGDYYYYCYNNYQNDFWETKNGFYYDGKIVLTDHVKLIEYDIQTGAVSKMATSEYVYPPNNIEVVVEDFCQIWISNQDQNRVVTIDSLAKSSEAFSTLLELENKKIWSRSSGLSKLLNGVQTDGEDLYIICSVQHWGGEIYAVVFQYDLCADNCDYSFYQYTSDTVDDSFYIVPRVE